MDENPLCVSNLSKIKNEKDFDDTLQYPNLCYISVFQYREKAFNSYR